jgi:ribosome-binding protein aMBF1 (putative translation factor)
VQKKKLSSSDLASKIEETKNSVINAIETLQERKFRSPALIKEISKYEDFLKKLNKNPNTFL